MDCRYWYLWCIAAIVMIFGYFAEKYMLHILMGLAKRTNWELDDIIVRNLRGRVGKWSILLSAYLLIEACGLADGIVDLIQHSIIVIFILSMTCMLSASAKEIINVYAKKTPKVFPSTSIFTNLTSSLLFILGIILTFQSLGISVAPLITALGVGGLAVALALQDTLSNFFAGLHLLIARPVRPKDYIRLDSGEEGYVQDITWRNTSIEDLMQNLIIVPNSKMTEAKIVNYNLPKKNIVILVPLAVNYDSDLDAVERISLEVAAAVMLEANGGVCDFKPSVRFHSFGDFSVEFHVRLCASQFSAQYYVRHEFMKRLQKRFIAENIALPEPTHMISIRASR